MQASIEKYTKFPISITFFDKNKRTQQPRLLVFAVDVAEGTTVLKPVRDQFYGDRSGYLRDPFGHLWSIATHKNDLSPDEVRKAGEAFFEEMSKTKPYSRK